MQTHKHWIIAVILIGLTAWLAPSPPDQENRERGVVKYVIDGDTLILNGSDTKIRLWGVDAPEREEEGYQEAKDELRQLVQGKNISYIVKDIDKYDRIVARIFLEDNMEVNRHLIEGKFALEYCRFTGGFYAHC